jgi:hypothetical protein
MPAGDDGRVYLVERNVRSKDELKAIVADYLEQSARRGEPAIIARGDKDLTRQLQCPDA